MSAAPLPLGAEIPPEAVARLRRGSQGYRIVRVFAALVAGNGYGATVAEARDAYPALAGAPLPKAFTAQVHSLARRGVLTLAGGRAGRSRFVPAGMKATREGPDDAFLVLSALESAHRRLGRWVSTREVEAEIRRRGDWQSGWNVNSVRKYLETLSKRRIRGPVELREPPVLRLAQGRSETGAPSAFWLPASRAADTPTDEIPVAPRSAADALRAAVRGAQEALGGLVTDEELAWWLSWPLGGASLESVLPPERLRSTIAYVVPLDRKHRATHASAHATGNATANASAHSRATGRIADAWGLFYADGARPAYLGIEPLPHDWTSDCFFRDAIEQMRLTEELAGIKSLEHRARFTGSEALAEIASARWAITSRFLSWCVSGRHEAALSHAHHRFPEMRRWLEGTPKLSDGQRESRTRWLRAREADLRAAATFLEATPRWWRWPSGRPLPKRIGPMTATTTLDQFEGPIAAAAAMARVSPRKAKSYLAHARRFISPDPQARSTRFRGERRGRRPSALSVIDLPDAWAGLYGAFRLTTTRALLDAAEQVLGHVLRDPRWLAERLERLPVNEAFARRALVVALGLMGQSTDFELACPDSEDGNDAAAWVLGTITGEWAEAEANLEQAKSRAMGDARDRVDLALARISMGNAISALG